MPNNFQEPVRNESRSSFFKSLPRPQRTAFLLLSVLSLGVFIFWILQFNSKINEPFKLAEKNETKLDDLQVAISNSDIDGDGLTDSEENTLYSTSPYLEDSDSDGVGDREEIEVGTDPNCAPGAQCDLTVTPAVTISSTTSQTQLEPNIDSSDEGNLQAMMSGVADAATLRSLLLDSGVSAEVLGSLSDEELIASYQDMLSSQGAAAE